MKLRSLGRGAVGVLLAFAGFAALIVLMGLLVKPDLSGGPVSYREEEVAAARQLRKIEIDPDKPIRLQVPVDYGEGKNASWYPKGEAPMLSELVAEGKLPAVTERVGPEPCVIRGAEGIGKYGGTWIRISSANNPHNILHSRLTYTTLVRFSPHGFPLVPHVAKSYAISQDDREFTFKLRKGMKWSDGHPFTADDILYWWIHECSDPIVLATPPRIMKVKGKVGDIQKIDDHTVKFIFPEPNGLFLAKLATYDGAQVLIAPEHYLRKFHPKVGDKELIAQRMKARRLASPKAVYTDVKDVSNPEHPRLWPWIYRSYKPSPPQTVVRNPYYWVVDPEGNQLPYIDRILFHYKSTSMLGVSVANGASSMQARYVKYDDYTLLMEQRGKYDFEVYHWYAGDRSSYVIHPNMNRRADDGPQGRWKLELLNDKRFRKALSLAINRREIIRADYNDQTTPAQVAPGPASYFYDEELYNAFTEYDPDRANQLLDEIGLTHRDFEGYRTFRDGSRMTFFLDYCYFTDIGPGQFIVDDWAAVGVRLILRERSRTLYYTEKAALKHDFNVWISNGEFYPLIGPRCFLPLYVESNFAVGWARWYERGGLYGDPRADLAHGCIEPPAGHPVRRAMEVYDLASAESDLQKQRDIFREALRITAENLWTINICTPPPVLAVVSKDMRNVPETLVYSWDFQSPGNAAIETFYFEKHHDTPGAIEQAKESIVKPVLPPDAPVVTAPPSATGQRVKSFIKYAFLSIAAMLVLMLALKHPYVGRRMLIMIPTLLLISVIAFTVIQLPPGDFLTTRIMQLTMSGDEADMQQIEDLKQMFHLEESKVMQYARWLGVTWFAGFDDKDEGLLQGNMGRSMDSLQTVNNIVGDRIILTILISLGTILFTWAAAIPIGIYSAVRQYSIGDYIFTFLGFIGMCVPAFLLALLLMYFSAEVLGFPVTGLFSSRYGAQPEWDWAKVVDLLKHIWVPILVLGVGGTAWMIRVMRANLLDELKKPYVVTAMAKGVRPMKLLFKYPVRIALNPFVSGIGGLFPQLVSGGAIVGMVLSLPTVGPLMLDALMAEDMYLAGSMLMVLSLLGVVGTLVSDLLLLWLDPRIRMQGGTR